MASSSKAFFKLLSGSAGVTCVKTLVAFAVNKFLAVVLGPASFACVAQFQNVMAIGQAGSSLALQNGWVSLTAGNKALPSKLRGVWRGGFRLTIFATFGLVVVGALFASFAPLAELFPGVPERYVRAAVIFAIPGVACANVTAICAAVMNGLGRYKRWAAISISASCLQALWVVILISTKTLSLLSVIATQSILTAFVSLAVAKKAGFSFDAIRSNEAHNAETFAPWKSFALMGLAPMLLTPLVLTAVRYALASRAGWEVAGLWQGVYRISDFFNVAVSSALGVILLPKVSQKMDSAEFKRTFYPLLLRTLAIALVLCLAVFFLRDLVVAVFLSSAFAEAGLLIPWQLIGDFFHSGGWCVGLVLVARRETKKFLAFELLSQAFFLCSTLLLLNLVDAYAPVFAYAIENFLYFVCVLIAVGKLRWSR